MKLDTHHGPVIDDLRTSTGTRSTNLSCAGLTYQVYDTKPKLMVRL